MLDEKPGEPVGPRARRGEPAHVARTHAALVAPFLLAACASSNAARGSESAAQHAAAPAQEEPSLEVALDARPRPTVALRMEVVDANDAGRGAYLAAQLDWFRSCLNRYRAPRGHAGGRFAISGFIRADGTFERSSVTSLDFGVGFERCLAADAAAWRWPASDIERVGFTASVVVHDSSRRDPHEVRALARDESHAAHRGAVSRAPAIAWSSLRASSPALEKIPTEMLDRSGPLSDCLWHAWPTAAPSAQAVVTMRVGPDGTFTGAVRGEGAPPAPELVECLGRMISVMSAPEASGGGTVSGHLTVGAGGGRLDSLRSKR